MVAQHCVSNSCQWIVHLKMVKMTKILNVHLYLYCASISVSICIYHSLENLQTRGHHNCIPFSQWQREILKAARGNKICPVQRIKIRVTRFFSQKKMQTRSGWSNFSEGPKEKQPAGLVCAQRLRRLTRATQWWICSGFWLRWWPHKSTRMIKLHKTNLTHTRLHVERATSESGLWTVPMLTSWLYSVL